MGLRSPATWEESHKVVLEYEQREAAHRAVAHSTYSTTAGEVPDSSAALAKAQKEIRELKAAAKAAAARPSGAAPWWPVLAPRVAGREQLAKSASTSASDKELRKQALAAKRGESTLAAKGGKGGGEGRWQGRRGQGQAQGQAEGRT